MMIPVVVSSKIYGIKLCKLTIDLTSAENWYCGDYLFGSRVISRSGYVGAIFYSYNGGKIAVVSD